MTDKEKNNQTEDKEANLYEKLAVRSKEIFAQTKEKTAEAYNRSVEAAKEELIQAGEFSRERGEKLKKYLERDLVNTRQGFKNFTQTFKPGSLGTGIQNTLGDILSALGSAFSEWSSKIEKNLTYKTGELLTPGTLMCKKCKGEMKFEKTAKIPPCPKCSATEFKKTE